MLVQFDADQYKIVRNITAALPRPPRLGVSYVSEAVAMVYDENHEPEKHIAGEIVWTWIFAASLVAVLLLAIAMAK